MQVLRWNRRGLVILLVIALLILSVSSLLSIETRYSSAACVSSLTRKANGKVLLLNEKHLCFADKLIWRVVAIGSSLHATSCLQR